MMLNVRIIFCIVFLFFLAVNVFAQSGRKYYHADGQLKRSTKVKLSDTDMTELKILGGSMIDPSGKNQIHLPTVERYLTQLFPDKEAEGILCVDLENQIYRDLRDNGKSTRKAKTAQTAFVQLIRFIRGLRPNLELGIYGIPFTVYYPSQEKRNSVEKFDQILKNVDIIFPSLYIQYPAIQKGKEANYRYLKRNLEIAFGHASKYGNKVFPFMWYLVHPSNRQYGNEALGKTEFGDYVDYVWRIGEQLHYRIDGIVIWNSPTPFLRNEVKFNILDANSHSLKGSNGETILDEYRSILK